ncbi:MAG TPA: hypothetical protein PLL09_04625 [Flavobacterium sp.]|uniref:hypothetical protein n=1 Tax=unclassified Flavobacterium TaxID=196869 RepID=UPI0025C430B8|nr:MULTISPECIES: hypothetical protein [unclassified Flavobacterium]HRE77093.1 hypothetical protein [Flavobacterium sp.]
MKNLIESYVDGETTYFIFNNETPEQSIYLYAYKQAIKSNSKVGNLIYRDGIYQITLTQF